MRTSGTYFDYRGHEFKQFFAGDSWVSAAISQPDESRFPDALEFGETRGQHWVRLPKVAIEDRPYETVRATWHGAEVTVDSQVTTPRFSWVSSARLSRQKISVWTVTNT